MDRKPATGPRRSSLMERASSWSGVRKISGVVCCSSLRNQTKISPTFCWMRAFQLAALCCIHFIPKPTQISSRSHQGSGVAKFRRVQGKRTLQDETLNSYSPSTRLMQVRHDQLYYQKKRKKKICKKSYVIPPPPPNTHTQKKQNVWQTAKIDAEVRSHPPSSHPSYDAGDS